MNMPLTSTPTEMPQVTQRKLRDVFSTEEIAKLTARSDWRGAWGIASTWLIIAVAFAVLARWPNALTFVLALVVIAGRQLGLAILEHEGAHSTLFKTRWMNNVLADWLCARPIGQNLMKYRAHHFVHHSKTGTDDDPDISLHSGYPISRRSMARKMARDLCGITGIKLLFGLMLMDAGVLQWTVANDVKKLPQDGRRWWDYLRTYFRNAGGALITNGILLGIFAASGHAWLFGVWVLAYVTPFPLFLRIRSLAEHGVLERVPDMFRNTRTTRAGWLARMTTAPMQVNYHLEHHAMASVPYYRLPQMHRMLRERNAVPEAPSYVDVLRLATSPAVA